MAFCEQRIMSNVAKSSKPKGFIRAVHSGFVYAAYNTWIQQLLALLFSDTVVFRCGDERGCEKDKDIVKLMIAMMYRGLIYDSACGTGCLFNLARMWIMWGKIPSIRLVGPSSDWTVSAGSWDSCPVHLSHFCTKVGHVGFLSFVLLT